MAAAFDPMRDVVGAAALLPACWPNFHDAFVRTRVFDAGDMRPEDNVFIGPQIAESRDVAPI